MLTHTPRSWRIALVAALLLVTIRIDAPPPARASTSWTWCCAIGQVWSLGYFVQQYAQIRFTDRRVVSLDWSYCRVVAAGWSINVTWCGAYRVSAGQIDVGFNYTKSIGILGLGVTQTCWSRRMVYASYQPWIPGYGADQRSGC